MYSGNENALTVRQQQLGRQNGYQPFGADPRQNMQQRGRGGQFRNSLSADLYGTPGELYNAYRQESSIWSNLSDRGDGKFGHPLDEQHRRSSSFGPSSLPHRWNSRGQVYPGENQEHHGGLSSRTQRPQFHDFARRERAQRLPGLRPSPRGVLRHALPSYDDWLTTPPSTYPSGYHNSANSTGTSMLPRLLSGLSLGNTGCASNQERPGSRDSGYYSN